MLIALIIALVVGLVAYILASLFPQTKAYAAVIGLLFTALSFLAQIGTIDL